jgi:DNA invertase Pin-like site-specific DNA recombinase
MEKAFKKGDPIQLNPMNRETSRSKKRAAEKLARRDRLKRLLESNTETLTAEAIALLFLVNVSTIKRDLVSMGIKLSQVNKRKIQ